MQREDAEKAFNNMKKSECYIFWEDTDDALVLENADMLKSYDLEEEYDIYIVDNEFNWTYVKTHETVLCGPYFSRRDIKNQFG